MAKRRLVVVGSGPAGIEAALEGAALGAAVSMVVGETVGGNALAHSLVPSKVLIARAAALDRHRSLGCPTDPLDWPEIGRQVAVEQRLEQARAEHRLAEAHVTLVPGEATVQRAEDGFVVEIDPGDGASPSAIRADAVVGATGSLAVLPGGMAPDGRRVLLPRHLPGPTPPPSPLAVLGTGIAGVEFASALVRLGIDVILVGGQDRILPSFSAHAAAASTSRFAERGGQLVTGFHVEEVQPVRDGLEIRARDGRRLEAAAVLVNLGRRPVLAPFGEMVRDGAGPLRHRDGFALAGDAIGAATMTEGAARRSGRAAARLVLGAPGGEWTADWEPRVAFSVPPVAAFGPPPDDPSIPADVERPTIALNELMACRLDACGDGYATALIDARGRLIGFEALGETAVELTAWAALWRESAIPVGDIRDLPIPSPSTFELFERLRTDAGNAW
jgi:pyruvate/2-oxoglutarate dehydrogenase complex dihydrolipoamide dehydrogenase (E3) component